jgi:hypothetical protein
LDVVDQLDLGPFLKAYRADGHGRAAYQPRMLLAVLLYGYCTGIRSSRQIERRCHEDIAFRVLAGNRTPDHVTIARFRVRHEQALAGLLVASLKLCAAAGMVRLGPGRLGRHQDRGQRRHEAVTLSANRSGQPCRPARAKATSSWWEMLASWSRVGQLSSSRSMVGAPRSSPAIASAVGKVEMRSWRSRYPAAAGLWRHARRRGRWPAARRPAPRGG